MDLDTFKWVRAVHIYGFVAWVGALVGCAFALRAHAAAGDAARGAFEALEKRLAMAMDIGATVAIAAGLWMLFGLEPSPLKTGGWMHAKLAAVVGLVALHGLVRVKVGRFSRGQVAAPPGWLLAAIELLVAAIVVLAAVRPF